MYNQQRLREQEVGAKDVGCHRTDKNAGWQRNIYLDTDTTEVAKVLEVLHVHGAIIDGEYPHQLIPIDGMDKIKVQQLLDGKLEEYGKVSISRNVKVTVM